jgi:hypothetical protein
MTPTIREWLTQKAPAYFAYFKPDRPISLGLDFKYVIKTLLSEYLKYVNERKDEIQEHCKDITKEKDKIQTRIAKIKNMSVAEQRQTIEQESAENLQIINSFITEHTQNNNMFQDVKDLDSKIILEKNNAVFTELKLALVEFVDILEPKTKSALQHFEQLKINLIDTTKESDGEISYRISMQLNMLAAKLSHLEKVEAQQAEYLLSIEKQKQDIDDIFSLLHFYNKC